MSGRLEGDRGTHDGSGASDKDTPYNPKNFRTILSPREQAKLMIFKAKANREVEERKRMELTKNNERTTNS